MDIETYNDGGKVVPYCICAKLRGVSYAFYSSSLINEFLTKIVEVSLDQEITIYTHNINFDGLLILDSIKEGKYIYDIFVRKNNIYWIKIYYLSCIILIRCSYKILSLSVKRMGEIISLEKQAFPYNFINRNTLFYVGEIPSPQFFNSMKDYDDFCRNKKIFDVRNDTIEYCIRDIEIVIKILSNIISIIEKVGGKGIIKHSFSFSSISYRIYSKRYDKWNITSVKTNKFDNDYYRNAYYGGRCEVFGNPLRHEYVHYFDFSGMYSQCMLEKFPIGRPLISHNNLSYKNVGFHTIRFKCDSYLPFLPIRKNKLFFPNGVMVGTYWYEEINNAIEKGRCEVLDHYSSYIFNSEEYVFRDYVKNFIEIRKESLYHKIFGKNMNNGLYGSFALNEDDQEYIVCFTENELEAYLRLVDVVDYRRVGAFFLIRVNKTRRSQLIIDRGHKWDFDYSKRNLGYAAIISSKARIKLNNALNDVLKSGYKLFYTDTDSIFAGSDKNRMGESVGEVKWSNVYNKAVFISSKFYFIEGEDLKLKGVGQNQYSFDELSNNFYNDTNSINFDNQLVFNKKDFILTQKEITKKILLSHYDKRVFINNKKETLPISYNPDI